MAAPFVLVLPDGATGGYYTLSEQAMKLAEFPAQTVRKLPRYPLVPATLLGPVAERIVVPPPELGCIESELQAIFARPQLLLRLLAGANVHDHGHAAQGPAGLVADDVGRHPRPNHISVLADIALFHIENRQLSDEQASNQRAVALALVRMGDVECRRGKQFLLTIAHELTHRSVGAEEAAGLTLGFDLAHAAHVKHGPEPRLALAESGFRSPAPGGGRPQLSHQPDDFGARVFVHPHRTPSAPNDFSASPVAGPPPHNPAPPS